MPLPPLRKFTAQDLATPQAFADKVNEMQRAIVEAINQQAGLYGTATVQNHLSLAGNQIKNVGTPTALTDAANVAYVQQQVQAATSTALSFVSATASVRNEPFFLGFFSVQQGSGHPGGPPDEIVPTPVSTYDGYQYSRPETVFIPIQASSLSANYSGFTPGQKEFPDGDLVANQGTGSILSTPYELWVGRSTDTTPGLLSISNYYSTSGAQWEGVALVFAIGIRSGAVG